MNGLAFKQLIIAELDAVYRLACHLTRSRVEAEDCVQETYLRALKSSATFELEPFGIRPWLFRILHNVIHTRYARGQREQEIVEVVQQQSPLDGAVRPECAGDTNTIDWETIDERLKHAIAELPTTYRAVFLLSAVEGLKYREIAEVIEAPVGTVMSRLSRARAMLMKQLTDVALEQRLDGIPKQ